MVMVKFASKCDVGGPNCMGRSPEYTEWPDCRVCGIGHVCLGCAVPGTLQQREYDRGGDESGPAEAVMTQSVICSAPECEGEYRDDLAAAVSRMAHPKGEVDVTRAF